MADLKGYVKVLDDVPEPLRDYYSEVEEDKGGGFKLNVPDGTGYDLIHRDGINRTLSTLREKEREYNSLRSKLQGREVPELLEAAEEVEKLREQASKAPKVEEAVAAAVQKAKAEHDATVSTMQGEIQALTGQLSGHLIEGAATKIINSSTEDGKPLLPRRLIPNAVLAHVRERTRIKRGDSGQLQIEVTEMRDGKPETAFDSEGKPMTLQGLLTHMASSEEFSFAWEPAKQGGSNAGGPAPTPAKSGGGRAVQVSPGMWKIPSA